MCPIKWLVWCRALPSARGHESIARPSGRVRRAVKSDLQASPGKTTVHATIDGGKIYLAWSWRRVSFADVVLLQQAVRSACMFCMHARDCDIFFFTPVLQCFDSAAQKTKTLQDSPSHRILWHMHEVTLNLYSLVTPWLDNVCQIKTKMLQCQNTKKNLHHRAYSGQATVAARWTVTCLLAGGNLRVTYIYIYIYI